MKKISIWILSAAIALSLAACSDSKTVSTKGTTAADATTTAKVEETTKQESSAEGSVEVTIDTTGNFTFKYGDTDILLGSTDTDSVLTGLGKEVSKLDVPNCAHDGTDHIYTYADIVLSIYEPKDNGTSYISDVRLLSDLVRTPEGLEIGMKADDAKEKYGEPDESTDTTLTYKRGTSVLLVTLADGKINSIEYMIP
ncbi:MAG: hypothetical protein IKG93_07675 [Clostridiales bacterium]|nr:hypothetical protein [Clostridiales bacterium]